MQAIPPRLNFAMRTWLSQYRKHCAAQGSMTDEQRSVGLQKLLTGIMRIESDWGLEAVAETRQSLDMDKIFNRERLTLV